MDSQKDCNSLEDFYCIMTAILLLLKLCLTYKTSQYLKPASVERGESHCQSALHATSRPLDGQTYNETAVHKPDRQNTHEVLDQPLLPDSRLEAGRI